MTDKELLELADKAEGDFVRRIRGMEDFRYDEQQEKFWDVTTGNLLAAKSVDGAIPREKWPPGENNKLSRPSGKINDIDTGLTVEGSTWWPGLPKFIHHMVISERGALPVVGAVCYNSYTAPVIVGREGDPTPWLNHVRRLYRSTQESEHFFDFCAHMIQRPDEKVNHGLVMAGGQGIGKDTALIPVRRGVGEWNAAEVGPDAITAQYNGYVKSVLLVINEVRPHDEDHKASNFYNLLKPVLAAPPDMLAMNLKYANTIYVRNLCHVILTTNDPLTMYIPAEDRRLFVMKSDEPKAGAAYFNRLYKWLYKEGGNEIVIGWLRTRDLSKFDPAAEPGMTEGKRQIIESAQHVRRSQVDDLIDRYLEDIGEVNVVFHRDLLVYLRGEDYFDDESTLIKQLNAKNFHYKMAERGFALLRNPTGVEWKCGNFRSRTAFVRGEEFPTDAAIKELQSRG